jgi:hypothetical protein
MRDNSFDYNMQVLERWLLKNPPYSYMAHKLFPWVKDESLTLNGFFSHHNNEEYKLWWDVLQKEGSEYLANFAMRMVKHDSEYSDDEVRLYTKNTIERYSLEYFMYLRHAEPLEFFVNGYRAAKEKQ